jgi:para-nitrobenzyl esterase
MPPITRRTLLRTACLTPFALRAACLLAQSESTTLTPLGKLRGQITEDGIRVFRGIPFAQPPIRFRQPEPLTPWPGERDATHFAPAAIQPGNQPQSEDCLYLNLWAPAGKGPYPVYIWIHGGGFTGGTSFDPTFDGTQLAREGIVCITVAYRLGIFGFLDLGPLLGPEYAGSANNGLRDLIAALQWVQQNVEAFSGDPTRVTIGGESAGAKLADILMGTPSARPLFHQIISESGGAERIALPPAATAVAHGFGDLFTKQTSQPLTTLKTAPPAALIELQDAFIKEWPQHFPLRAQVDGTLLPRLPIQTIAAGNTRGKRLLIGTNQDESASFIGPHPTTDPTAANLGNLPLAKFNQAYSHYQHLYPDLTPVQLRIRAVTAEEYWVPSVRVAEAHQQNANPAWMYRLDFTETSGRLAGYSFHGLDIPLVWDKPHPNVENAPQETQLAQTVHQAWVSFLQGNTPAAPGLPEWPQYHLPTRATMILNTQSKIEDQPHQPELNHWTHLL